MVRDNVRRFARNEFEPGVASWYINETFPNDLIPGLGKMGVLGANLTGYGCAGLDATAYGLIMRELEYVDSGLRSFASVQGASYVSDLGVWYRGPEDTILAKDGGRRDHWMLWLNGAGQRQRPQFNEDSRQESRWRLHTQWQQNVDYKFTNSQGRNRLGEG